MVLNYLFQKEDKCQYYLLWVDCGLREESTTNGGFKLLWCISLRAAFAASPKLQFAKNTSAHGLINISWDFITFERYPHVLFTSGYQFFKVWSSPLLWEWDVWKDTNPSKVTLGQFFSLFSLSYKKERKSRPVPKSWSHGQLDYKPEKQTCCSLCGTYLSTCICVLFELLGWQELRQKRELRDLGLQTTNLLVHKPSNLTTRLPCPLSKVISSILKKKKM